MSQSVTYPVVITATDPSSTNRTISRTFQITVGATAAQVPGPLASITSPSQDTSSIVVAWTPPTTGGVCDNGVHQIQYRAATPLNNGAWLNATPVPYCTPGHGSITDAFGNVWSVNATNHPVVNGITDAYSSLSILYLVGGTIWHLDLGGTWWGSTPVARITGAPSWFSGGGTSPLLLTISGLSAGATYNVRGYATSTAGNGAYTATINVATQSAPLPGSVGVVASSAFLTADFQVPVNYPAGGLSGQTVISRRAWGGSGGTIADNDFQLMGDATITTGAAKVNFGMLFFKIFGGANGWNSDQSINKPVFQKLIDNLPKWDPLGITSVAVGMNFNGLGWDQSPYLDNPTNYATGMGNLVSYLSGVTLSDGRKFPLAIVTGHDEPPDNAETTCASYYNAFIPKVRAANPNVLIAGPTRAYKNWTDFPGLCGNNLDIFSWNTFLGGTTAGMAAVQANDGWPIDAANFRNEVTEANTDQGPRIKAFMRMGYSIDWDAGSPAEDSWVGAMCGAKWFLDQLAISNRQIFNGWWTAAYSPYSDHGGTEAVIGSGGRPSPLGFLMGQCVRKIYGPRWAVTTNSAGLQTVACNPTPTMASMMVVNRSRGAQNNKTVAFSRWPVNTSGTAQGSVWQLTNTAQTWGDDGTTSNVQFTNGVSAPLNFPDPSVTIISVGS